LQIEYAELSLLGDREENQDRVRVVTGEHAALMVVVDGMGGHANGALAAETAVDAIAGAFRKAELPLFDPQGFMHRVIGEAHDRLVDLGARFSVEARPRATCAVCLVQDGASFWAHVGDSRIYWLRGQQVRERTRDHSHVELLLQEGLITEDELTDHPMRNFVECCLGGDSVLPGMSITNRKAMKAGDIVLACSDGLWSGLADEEIAQLGHEPGALAAGLGRLGDEAVRACGPYADNTSAAALRWDG